MCENRTEFQFDVKLENEINYLTTFILKTWVQKLELVNKIGYKIGPK